MIAAVELLAYVEAGVEICFRSIGDLVFLDAATEAATPRSLERYVNPEGMTCGEVYDNGAVVLVATITEQDSWLELSTCQATTTRTLRLRADLGSSVVRGLAPYNVTLVASARASNWFKLDILGAGGWISARFARANDIRE